MSESCVGTGEDFGCLGGQGKEGVLGTAGKVRG